MRISIIIAYFLLLLALSGCKNIVLEVSDNRAFINADGDIFIDVKINIDSLVKLNESGEALYLNVFECDSGQNGGYSFPLVSREPVELVAGSAWMRFAINHPSNLKEDGACGYLSSEGYSLDSFSSDVFTMHLKAELAQ
ncbi:hypothetical protein FSZ31_01065 [Sphingorhabdus soli]|uniref:Lipoprotein n=1 Tax=Flavisphingopyxis soli TaxID=2601267 RepID=A0A5C6UK38_9SPHN|nr:hypothetical protein [Sphingorhabdus soli]TXC73382.1 hypothetical protein FSZ31_01065 [Sphingorhabdus soli]